MPSSFSSHSNILAQTRPQATPLPLSQVIPWAVLGVVLSVVLLYFVGAEQGATSLLSGHYVHEFVHDGRHILGFPCH